MSASKTCLWVCLALCVVVGSEVVYKGRGQEVTLHCVDVDHNKDVEWKHNNTIIFKITAKNGRLSKGTADVVKKAKLVGTNLKITSLGIRDSGLYSFTGSDKTGQKITRQFSLHVVSVSVSPSERVLYETDVTLSCDIGEDSSAQVQWLKPPGDQPYRDSGKVITLKSVTSADAGQWTCLIKDEKGTMLEKIPVDISVDGPLTSPETVVASPGGTAELPCFLANPSCMQIIGGGWTRDPPADLLFPFLDSKNDGLQWNGTNVPSRILFSRQQLSTNFTVILKNVQASDAGPYVCNLRFEGENSLNTRLILKVQDESAIVIPSRTTGPSPNQEIIASAGGVAELPCTHSSSSSQRVVGGGWTRDPPTDVQFPVLLSTEAKDLHWNSANVLESKVTFSDQQLNTNFNVQLKNVEYTDAGVYICTLVFEDKTNLSTAIVLKVVEEGAVVAPDFRPPSTEVGLLQKPVLLNLALWVWVAISAGSLLLIVLVISIVLIHCRGKQNKRKVKEQVKPSTEAYYTQELMPVQHEFTQKRTERRHGNKDRPLPQIPSQNRAYKHII